jgi:HlyD family secretion protein
MPAPNSILLFLKRQPRWRIVVALLGVALAAFLLRGGGKSARTGATFAARRGPLDITVVEGGSVQALEYQEIKCEVRVGYQGLKILKIVEEGYQVTEDDIRTNKVLVELDSSELEKQIVQQEIQYQSAAASYTDAQQGYDIQLNQNLSDLKAAEQKVRFARMDFDKFLGTSAAQDVIEQLGLDAQLAAAATNAPSLPLEAEPTPPLTNGLAAASPLVLEPARADAPRVVKLAGSQPSDALPVSLPSPDTSASPRPPDAVLTNLSVALAATPSTQAMMIDFTKYANIEILGDGEAKQKLRKFEEDLQMAQKEFGQARATLEGTQRLYEKGFVTKIDRERDDIAFENNRLKVETAQTARDLYLKYEFVKLAEESLSKFSEAVRELDRARKAAISKLAQAEARLKSAQGQYNIQSRQRKENQEQLKKCSIHAEKPGLVVYGSAGQEMFYYGDQERIREGATVRERQSIITIPDMTKMSVKVKIHESYIKRIQKGQKARITVDAFPDKVLDGEVTKVGVLPDSQNMWMNPDMKVYLTTISIEGTQDWLKPGMSAKVEVLVNRLTNVVHVPIQAVTPDNSKQVCYVARGLKPERREVEVGEMNDEFIEIKSGLKEGEAVLLRAPESTDRGTGEKKPAGSPKVPTTPEPGPAVASPPGKV